eukprot:3338242-Rhodomonas_salina.3
MPEDDVARGAVRGPARRPKPSFACAMPAKGLLTLSFLPRETLVSASSPVGNPALPHRNCESKIGVEKVLEARVCSGVERKRELNMLSIDPVLVSNSHARSCVDVGIGVLTPFPISVWCGIAG